MPHPPPPSLPQPSLPPSPPKDTFTVPANVWPSQLQTAAATTVASTTAAVASAACTVSLVAAATVAPTVAISAVSSIVVVAVAAFTTTADFRSYPLINGTFSATPAVGFQAAQVEAAQVEAAEVEAAQVEDAQVQAAQEKAPPLLPVESDQRLRHSAGLISMLDKTTLQVATHGAVGALCFKMSADMGRSERPPHSIGENMEVEKGGGIPCVFASMLATRGDTDAVLYDLLPPRKPPDSPQCYG